MFKFNSNHIMTGQIKQILNAFNLPSYRVYTAQNYKYFLDHGVESPELADGLYIKGTQVKEYKDGKWGRDFDHFGYNVKVPNITRTLPICNNKYDSDTHEYLGEFLRFQRDYLGIDLMSLYNCFSNRVCNNINLSINKKEIDTTKIIEHIDSEGNIKYTAEHTYKTTRIRRAFYSKDTSYIIYMLPIKFFKEYTIALDNSVGTEICCGFYTDYLHELPDKLYLNENQVQASPVDVSQFLSDRTYKYFPELRFNNSILWKGITLDVINDVITDCLDAAIKGSDLSAAERKKIYKQRIFELENSLKLFIKIPVKCQTSIVVLEGDYTDFNNMTYVPKQTTKSYQVPDQIIVNGKEEDKYKEITYTYTEWVKTQNKFITNYETTLYGTDYRGNTTTTELPDVEDRPFRPISPLQLLMFNTKESYPFSTRLLEYLSGNVITEWDDIADNIRRTQKVMKLNNKTFAVPGAWEGKMRNILYDYMMNGKPSGEQFTYDINHDTLGYVDKDVEKFYTAWSLEFCRDSNGDKIPLTEYVNGQWIPVYGIEPKLLTEQEKKLLTDNRKFLLTTRDMGTVPLYEQVYVPIGSIGTINIYDEEE